MAASGAPALVAALREGGAAAARALTACIALCGASAGRADLSRCGAVAATVSLVGSSSDAAVSTTACQLLAQLCAYCAPNAAAAVAVGCLPTLTRLLDGEDRVAALEAYTALMAVVVADGPLGVTVKAHVAAAAAAGVADAAARLVARPRGGGGAGDPCLVPALQLLLVLTSCSEPVAERVAASGALSGAVALLRCPDEGLAQAALAFANTAMLSAAASRALALDADAAPALIEVLMAAPAVGGALPDSPYYAASVLGGMAKVTMGRARADAAPNAVAAEVRRAGGVPRIVELLRATVAGALPEDVRFARRAWVVPAFCALVIMDLEARPAALAAGAVPLLARVVADVSAGGDSRPPERGLDSDRRVLNALDALAVLSEVPQGGRAALAAQPGLAGTAVRILGAGVDGWLQPAPNQLDATHRDSVLAGAAGLLRVMLQRGDALGTAAASEVAAAGGAPYLVRLCVLGGGRFEGRPGQARTTCSGVRKLQTCLVDAGRGAHSLRGVAGAAQSPARNLWPPASCRAPPRRNHSPPARLPQP
jgi:hypothetical protein